MASRSLNTSRLKSQLLTSGLQQKDPPLFQVIDSLIGALEKLIQNVDTGNVGTPSTSVNINQTGGIGIPGMMGADGEDGAQGPPGVPGVAGTIGTGGPAGPTTIGPMGLNGIDGDDGYPIPGARGLQGPQGIQGPQGPIGIGLNGEDGEPASPILLIQNVGGGGGGGGTTSGTEASLPASGADGELYLPTNGVYIHRYDGSIWSPWGPIFPLKEPIDSDFAWVNQGGASVTTTQGGIYLFGPAGAGINWRIRKKAAPATPYVITTAILVDGLSVDFHQIGLIFRESGTGRLHVFTYQTNNNTLLPVFNSVTYSSPTVFNAAYTQSRYQPFRLLFLRIADDGVNRICSYSPDGQNWLVFSSVARTNYITANEVGFAVNAESATFGVGINLISWKET